MAPKPRQRRSPVRHTVHTQDPRYQVEKYGRGQGERIANMSGAAKPDTVASPVGFFTVYNNGKVVPNRDGYSLTTQDPELLATFIADVASAWELPSTSRVWFYDETEGRVLRIPPEVAVKARIMLLKRRNKAEKNLASGYRWIGKGPKRVLLTPDGRAIYSHNLRKPNTERFEMVFSKKLSDVVDITSAWRDPEFYTEYQRGWRLEPIIKNGEATTLKVQPKTRFNPSTERWEVWALRDDADTRYV